MTPAEKRALEARIQAALVERQADRTIEPIPDRWRGVDGGIELDGPGGDVYRVERGACGGHFITARNAGGAPLHFAGVFKLGPIRALERAVSFCEVTAGPVKADPIAHSIGCGESGIRVERSGR